MEKRLFVIVLLICILFNSFIYRVQAEAAKMDNDYCPRIVYVGDSFDVFIPKSNGRIENYIINKKDIVSLIKKSDNILSFRADHDDRIKLTIFTNKGKKIKYTITVRPNNNTKIIRKKASVRSCSGSSFVIISWNKIKSADGYVIYKKSGKEYKLLSVITNRKTTEMRIKRNNSNELYYVAPYVTMKSDKIPLRTYTQKEYTKWKEFKKHKPEVTVKMIYYPKDNNSDEMIPKYHVSWNRIKDASGYEIYKQTKNKKKENVKYISNPKKTSLEIHADDSCSGRFYVRPIKIIDSKVIEGRIGYNKYVQE